MPDNKGRMLINNTETLADKKSRMSNTKIPLVSRTETLPDKNI